MLIAKIIRLQLPGTTDSYNLIVIAVTLVLQCYNNAHVSWVSPT